VKTGISCAAGLQVGVVYDYESNDALDDFGGFVLAFLAAVPTTT
jgi:hypothetical protein